MRAGESATARACAPGRPAGTARAYVVDWALFDDWCAATGQQALPATAEAVVAFLDECPAAPATLARRVSAINDRHRAAGVPAPGDQVAVGASLRVLRGASVGEERVLTLWPGIDPRQVSAIAGGLPAQGWPRGLFGRRDACLLVLAGTLGLRPPILAQLTAGDVQVRDGVLAVVGRSNEHRVARGDDPRGCAACVVRRWLAVLAVLDRSVGVRTLRGMLFRAREITPASDHVCGRPLPAVPPGAPLFVPIDRHGYPAPRASLSARSITAIIDAHLRGVAPEHYAVARLTGEAERAAAGELLDIADAATGVDGVSASHLPPRQGPRTAAAPSTRSRRRTRDQFEVLDAIWDRLDHDIEALERRINQAGEQYGAGKR